MTTVLYNGDSISDDTYQITVPIRSGMYCGMVTATMGWQRVGQTPGAANRAAISGVTLSDMGYTAALRAEAGVNSFAARVAAYAPDVLVTFLGTNDFLLMGTGGDLDTWAAGWKAFYADVAALPKRPQLVAVGLMATEAFPAGQGPWWMWPQGGNEWLRARMDMVTREYALANGSLFVPLAGMRADQMRPDGHPNARGHAYIAGEILTSLGVT